MDSLREVLTGRGVSHCVAFVVGARVAGCESALDRWLQAGYELGNHSFDHPRASDTEPRAFLDSIARCDALLAALGAFDDGRRRWFRYPFLDRGRDPERREELARDIRGMGYELVHASVDLYDHRYERVLAEAEAANDTARAARILARYQTVAWQSVRHGASRSRTHAERPVVQIPFFHFGRVSERGLAGALDRMGADGVEWRPLAEAVAEPTHRAFDRDPRLRGLVLRAYPTPTGIRIGRALARLSDRLGLFGQRREGPRWPYWI